MINKKTIFLFVLIILSSCSPAHAQTTTPTVSPTLAPTATPMPLKLTNFKAEMEGVGEHGNMACITYLGDKKNLEGLAIKADTSQEDKILDSNVPLESVNGKNCFEMVDAKYEANKPVSITLYFINLEKQLLTSTQTLNLGKYLFVPFLNWYFGEGGFGNKVSLPRLGHPEAYDFSPMGSDQFPKGVGQPVLLPSNGILETNELVPNRTPDIHNMFFYLPDAGFYLQIGHTQWSLFPDPETEYKSGTIIGYLTNETGWAHVHTTLRKPNSWNKLFSEGELKKFDSFIDMLNPEYQLDCNNLECGFFICKSLPQEFIDQIEKGLFIPKYDSEGGEIMPIY